MNEKKFTVEFDALKEPLIENTVSDYNEFKNKFKPLDDRLKVNIFTLNIILIY